MSSKHAETPDLSLPETERQIVALHLGEEVYGLDIAAIHTVIMPQAITYVPKAPPFVKGVINLRGRVLPVIDLRSRFGLPPAAPEHNRNTRIVIVETEGLSAGLIVDAVSEVLRLSTQAIDPPSHLVASPETDCITGIGRIPVGRRGADMKDARVPDQAQGGEERLIILLDIHKTVSPLAANDAQSLAAAA